MSKFTDNYIEDINKIKEQIPFMSDNAYDSLYLIGIKTDIKRQGKKVDVIDIYPIITDMLDNSIEISKDLRKSDNYLKTKVALLIDISNKTKVEVRNLIDKFFYSEITNKYINKSIINNKKHEKRYSYEK